MCHMFEIFLSDELFSFPPYNFIVYAIESFLLFESAICLYF